MAKKRSWTTFSLRTLIIITVLSSFVFGWLGMVKDRGKQREEAIAAIRSMGGTVRYKLDGVALKSTSDWYGPIDKFARKQLGNAFFDEVKEVNLFAKKIGTPELRYLKHFPELEILHLGMNRLDDESLDHLPKLKQLRVLTLQVTGITDKGLPKLHKFQNLERLLLPSKEEQVSVEALTRLRLAMPNCNIEQ